MHFTHLTFPLHSLSVLTNFLNSATTSSSQPHYLSTSSLPDQSNPPSTLPLILTNMHCNIISFNASLLPKLDDLLSILHLHSPDICETWLHSDITYAELSFPSYTLFCKDHNTNMEEELQYSHFPLSAPSSLHYSLFIPLTFTINKDHLVG